MRKIAHFIVHSWAVTAVAALLCMITWGHTIIQGDTGSMASYANLLLYLVFGVLVGRYGDQLAMGSLNKATLPITLFFMSCAINPQLAPWQGGTVYLMLLVGAYHILINTYRNHTAMGSYFTAFCLIGIASLYCPQILYAAPLWMLCSGFMQSLHLRTALASLLGLLTPYWTAFCVLFLTDNTSLTHSFVEKLTMSTEHASTPIHIPLGEGNTIAIPMMAIQMVWTLLLAVPAIVHHILSSTSKVRTRANRHMQIGILMTLLIGTLILPSLYTALQPAVVTLTAILSYDIFIDERKGRNVWLITSFCIWLLIVGLVWSNFLTY